MIEFVRGGDLMFHMQRQRRLPEEHARFYAAEISLALNFLHTKGINVFILIGITQRFLYLLSTFGNKLNSVVRMMVNLKFFQNMNRHFLP